MSTFLYHLNEPIEEKIGFPRVGLEGEPVELEMRNAVVTGVAFDEVETKWHPIDLDQKVNRANEWGPGMVRNVVERGKGTKQPIPKEYLNIPS